MRRFATLLAVGLFGVVGVMSASGAAGATRLTVKMWEFKLVPAVKTVRAGKVTFVVSNVGKINHEMIVVKTNVPAGKLKQNANHRVSERGSVGEVEVHRGETKKLTLALAPGKYQLFCNIAAHYGAGQWSAFTVK